MASDTKGEVSQEIDALLRFYTKRKLISVSDIREFSEHYVLVNKYLKDQLLENNHEK